jgi:hypothetical protein
VGPDTCEFNSGIPYFQTLSQTVERLVELLEQNSPAALLAACAHLSRPELAETYLPISASRLRAPG